MEYISVKAWAAVHGVSERTARNYCAQNRMEGAFLVGKTWNIPADALPPKRSAKSSESPLLRVLKEEKSGKTKGGIYHRVQIDLTYSSNHIEGSRLTHDQTHNLEVIDSSPIWSTLIIKQLSQKLNCFFFC